MASVPSKLQGYLVKELKVEFPITDDRTLTKWASAISRAMHTYITTDVEVKIGQQVEGVDSLAGKVIAKTVTPGDLF
jgi:hypothetical protein